MTDKDKPDNELPPTEPPPVDPKDTPHSINEPPGSEIHPEDLPPPGQSSEPGENQPPERAEPKTEPEPETFGSAHDPDELEDEIDQAEDDGDVEVHHKPAKKGKKR